MVTLCQPATESAKMLHLRGVLDPFGYGGVTQCLGKLDDCGRQADLARCSVMALTKVLSILKMSIGKSFEMRERGVARTEIIEGDADAERPAES